MSELDTVDRAAAADRVVLSYPADLPDRAVERLSAAYYRKYLTKTLGRVEAGETGEEFTDVGCCGSQRHVRLRVERVEGGSRVGPETAVEYVAREACGLDGEWTVQNEHRGVETEK